ncbi:MAG: hypothetical protein EXS30_09405 [Pedosphaera sp.]|nr:hypothetical protein [Pedosphaera sp.]
MFHVLFTVRKDTATNGKDKRPDLTNFSAASAHRERETQDKYLKRHGRFVLVVRRGGFGDRR